MKNIIIISIFVLICVLGYFVYIESQSNLIDDETKADIGTVVDIEKNVVENKPTEEPQSEIVDGDAETFEEYRDSSNFIEERDSWADEFAEEFKNKNPDSVLDVEAILKQTSDVSLISAALQAYEKDHAGIYPDTLDMLVPDYTPDMMFPNGQIPLDYDNTPFDYKVSDDSLDYTICHIDLEGDEGTICY